ncbi:MAG: hypothetical protein IJ246_03625 [Clostridia bacterium]|nr:hypothetical protein [Clostridia bacterium]
MYRIIGSHYDRISHNLIDPVKGGCIPEDPFCQPPQWEMESSLSATEFLFGIYPASAMIVPVRLTDCFPPGTLPRYSGKHWHDHWSV